MTNQRTKAQSSAHEFQRPNKLPLSQILAKHENNGKLSLEDMFLFFCLAAMFTGFIFWRIGAYFQPYGPELYVEAVAVSPFYVSSSSQITAAWNISLVFNNSCHVSQYVFYNNVVSIYYMDRIVATTIVKPISQNPGDRKSFQVSFPLMSTPVDEWVPKAMTRDQKVNQAVYFNIDMDSVMFHYEPNIQERFTVAITCRNVRVQLSSGTAGAGKMHSIAPMRCNFTMLDESWLSKFLDRHQC